jgi:hypothetical protein
MLLPPPQHLSGQKEKTGQTNSKKVFPVADWCIGGDTSSCVMQVLQSLRALIDGSTATLPLPSSRSAALIDASTAALPFPSSRSAALLPTLSTFPEIYKLEVDLRQFTFTNSHTCFVAKAYSSCIMQRI